jgi:hypothetical protein
MQKEKINTLERHCPRLGGPIQFSYCRFYGCDGSGEGESQKVCFKILDCWWEYFDVVSYLKSCLTPKEFGNLEMVKPHTKISTIIDLIQKTRQNTPSS